MGKKIISMLLWASLFLVPPLADIVKGPSDDNNGKV